MAIARPPYPGLRPRAGVPAQKARPPDSKGQSMAQAPTTNPFVQAVAAAEGVTPEEVLKALQKRATSKQYNMSVIFKITETGTSGKDFYDGSSTWSGVPYAIVVVTEAMMIEMLKKFNELGGAVATGTPPPTAAQ